MSETRLQPQHGQHVDNGNGTAWSNEQFRRRRKVRHTTWRVCRALLIGLVYIWVLAPFYFLALVSVQSRADSLTTPPVWFPVPNLQNFIEILSKAFSDGPASAPSDLIWPGIVNSAVVGVSVSVLCVAFGALAGYAFARYRFPGYRSIPIALLGSQMIPALALMVPFYIVLRNIGLTNTRAGIIVADLSITLPFAIWLFRSYFQNIPIEVERAARMDGCGRFEAFVRVALPLARPGLISVGLFSFMVAWNDFVFALVLNSDVDSMLIQPAIAGLYNVREQSFGLMAAGALLAALPTMVVALVAQRYLVRGLLSGIGKG